jgi:hypothetical protein
VQKVVAYLKFDRLRAIHGFKIHTFGSGRSNAGCSSRFQCHIQKDRDRMAMSLTPCKARGFHDER